MRFRLSLLMLLQYAVPGAVWPLFSKHLENLGFTPREISVCCATQALASVLAPLVAGHVADRWVAAERCLAVCGLLAGVDLWVLADLDTPAAVCAASLGFWLLINPAVMLGIAICFAHLPHAERQYGPTRMWGTVGWMLPGWLLAYWFSNPEWLSNWIGRHGHLSDAFRLGSLSAFVLAGYALSLPHTPPQRQRHGGAAPLAALRLLRGRAFAVYAACNLGVCVTVSFSSQGAPLLLARLGVPLEWLGPTLTLAQVTEVLSLGLLPMFLLRLGLRGTMLMGLGSWVAYLGILAWGRPLGLVIGSLGFNGLCISGFIVAGQLFVNRSAGSGLRASAQALLTFVNGLGMLIGHLLVGWLRGLSGGELPLVFLVGAVLTAALLLLFLVGFHDRRAA